MTLGDNRRKNIEVIASLLWPFLALPLGIKNIRNSYGRVFLVLFITFFGYQLIYQVHGTELGSGADSGRYAMLFSWAASLQDISFPAFFALLGSHDNIDYFNPLLIYGISRITDNPHVYFMVFAFIFSLFYVYNITLIMRICKNRGMGIGWAILAIAFCLVISVHDMGGIRMPLAYQVYVMGALRYFLLKKWDGLLWMPVSILVHFSMFIMVAAAAVFLLIRKLNVRYFYIFFLFAFLLSSINMESVQRLFDYLPGDISERLFLYTNDLNMEKYEEGGRYYLGAMNIWGMLDSFAFRTYVLVMVVWMGLASVRIPDKYNAFFKFAVFAYSVGLILTNMPSGYRFLLPSAFMFFGAILILMDRDSLVWRKLYKVNGVLAVLLVLFIFHRLRFIADEVGFSLLYTNFYTMFLVNDNVPILSYLK